MSNFRWEYFRNLLDYTVPTLDTHMSITGNDLLSDGTESNPHRTPGKVLAGIGAGAGLNVGVASGEYNGPFFDLNLSNTRVNIFGHGTVVFKSLLNNEAFIRNQINGSNWLGDKGIEVRDYSFPYNFRSTSGQKTEFIEHKLINSVQRGINIFKIPAGNAGTVSLKRCLWVNQEVAMALGDCRLSTFDNCIFYLYETTAALQNRDHTMYEVDAKECVFINYFTHVYRYCVFDASCRFGDAQSEEFQSVNGSGLLDSVEYIITSSNTLTINGQPHEKSERFIFSTGDTITGTASVCPIYDFDTFILNFPLFDGTGAQQADPLYIDASNEIYAKASGSVTLTAGINGNPIGYLGEGIGNQADGAFTNVVTPAANNLQFNSGYYEHIDDNIDARWEMSQPIDYGSIVTAGRLPLFSKIAFRDGQSIDETANLDLNNPVMQGTPANTSGVLNSPIALTDGQIIYVIGYDEITIFNTVSSISTTIFTNQVYIASANDQITEFINSLNPGDDFVYEASEDPDLFIISIKSSTISAADCISQPWKPYIQGVPITVDSNGNSNGDYLNFDANTKAPLQFRYIMLAKNSLKIGSNIKSL